MLWRPKAPASCGVDRTLSPQDQASWEQHLPATSPAPQRWPPPSSRAAVARSPQRPLSLLAVCVGPCPPPGQPLATAGPLLKARFMGMKIRRPLYQAPGSQLLPPSCHIPTSFPAPPLPRPTQAPGRNTQRLFFLAGDINHRPADRAARPGPPQPAVQESWTPCSWQPRPRIPSAWPSLCPGGRLGQDPPGCTPGRVGESFQLRDLSFCGPCMYLHMPRLRCLRRNQHKLRLMSPPRSGDFQGILEQCNTRRQDDGRANKRGRVK